MAAEKQLDKIERLAEETHDTVLLMQPSFEAMKKELWTPEGHSRMQAVESCTSQLSTKATEQVTRRQVYGVVIISGVIGLISGLILKLVFH